MTVRSWGMNACTRGLIILGSCVCCMVLHDKYIIITLIIIKDKKDPRQKRASGVKMLGQEEGLDVGAASPVEVVVSTFDALGTPWTPRKRPRSCCRGWSRLSLLAIQDVLIWFLYCAIHT